MNLRTCSKIPLFISIPLKLILIDQLFPSFKSDLKQLFAKFNEAVVKFYSDTQLDDYFKKQSSKMYNSLLKEVNSVAPSKKYISILELYFGVKRNNYNIIVSAFSFNGIGRSKFIATQKGVSVYQFVTSNPSLESEHVDLNNLTGFSFGYNDANYFREVATHELCHSFLHETLREDTAIISLINKSSHFYTDSIQHSMESIGYYGWAMCFEEHLVRQTEIMVAQKLGNDQFAKEYRSQCLSKGFVYIDQFIEIMGDYQSGHSNKIADYIPKLLGELKAI